MAVNVREKPKGSGIWWIFINHQGKRKSKKIGTDENIAKEVAEKVKAKLVLNEFNVEEINEKCPTFEEYVFGWNDTGGGHPGWINTKARLSLKSSTRNGYKGIIENHLIQTFGSERLNKITSRSISDYIYRLFNEGLRSGTIKNIKNCLSSILKHAANQDGYLKSNPARGVEVPIPENETPSRVPSPFTWFEKNHLENVFLEHFTESYPLVICGLRTGLRIGELIGLKLEDVDFHNRLLFVQRNITRGKITTPKSKASKRLVRMTSQLCQVLKAHRGGLELTRKELPEWVFCNKNGGFLNYGNFVDRVWNKAIKKSELLKRTPHDMRHTYATLRLSKGDSLAEVSKEMGHGSPDITFKTYYKWMPKESQSNIDELDGGLSKNEEVKLPDCKTLQLGADRVQNDA